jgi:hypothetical protein
MTNHPNRSRTYFTVRYGHNIAKFSSNRDAMHFAEAQSQAPELRDCWIEVSHKTGLVGQYRNGQTTPEFQLHHDCRDNG